MLSSCLGAVLPYRVLGSGNGFFLTKERMRKQKREKRANDSTDNKIKEEQTEVTEITEIEEPSMADNKTDLSQGCPNHSIYVFR